ncbi:hypothetical protein E4U57_004464 [Claviceps arundinis]|uniref:Uncharacterized protein n=1 Tax=Claviceps arundinis TaxID=1623583 RepID=A0A9P7SPY0_9HYPO|nr:hypothetical protein E4U57_004464 [Claviceps arundinis]KAG5965846.1 hypothetical protein E4U56_001550 [Claviceps arundinis]
MYSTHLLSMAFVGLSILSMAAATPRDSAGIAARAPRDSASINARAPAPTWDHSNNGDDEWKNPDCPAC